MQTVEQRHREAAAGLYPEHSTFRTCIRAGEADHFASVQAFARFEAALPPSGTDGDAAQMRAAELLRRTKEALSPGVVVAEPDVSWLLAEARFLAESALALPPSGIAEMVREMCAKAAEGRRDSYVEPTDWDYGAQDACFSIASAIRSLDLSNKGVG